METEVETTPSGGRVDALSYRRSPVPDDYDDVELARWPDDEEILMARRRDGRATLLVVGRDQRPPEGLGPLEDWVREPYDTIDLYARREGLRRRIDARSPAVFDQDGLLHRGRRWVDLSPLESRLVRALLEREGEAVSRSELALAVYGPDTVVTPATNRAVDAFVRRARRRLAPLGIRILTVRAYGFVIQVRELPA